MFSQPVFIPTYIVVELLLVLIKNHMVLCYTNDDMPVSLANIQWFLSYKCWNTVVNCSHWLGSLLHHHPLDLLIWQSGHKHVAEHDMTNRRYASMCYKHSLPTFRGGHPVAVVVTLVTDAWATFDHMKTRVVPFVRAIGCIPYWHFHKTCQIRFALHVYGLAFISGGGGDGGGITGEKAG